MPHQPTPPEPTAPTDQLDATFAALADPTRRAILARLSQGDTTVSQLAAPFAMSLPAVSRHIKVLEAAGLLTKAIDAQSRNCHLETETLRRAGNWIAQYKTFWDNSFDALDTYLTQLQTPHSGES